ncbi:MAG: hypothetical protein IJB95_03305, partial [Clostridia bacterium]|nr:hypothetical protein [Clostridia bacterium]
TYSEESLLSKLTLAEQAYENCSTLEGYHPKKTLGEMYTAMGFYYPANDQGKESVRGLVARANQHGVDKYLLMGLLSCPAVPEDILAELEVGELKAKKQRAIEKMSTPVDFQLESTAINVNAIPPKHTDDAYLKEAFLTEIELGSSIPYEVKQAIAEGAVEFKSQLVYVPGRCTQWVATPATFNWRYSPSEGYVHWGTYTYGGGMCDERKPTSTQESANNFIKDTFKDAFIYAQITKLKDNYIREGISSGVPAELRVSSYDARSSFARAKKISDYMISEFTCIEPSEYTCTINNDFYYPVFYLWLKAGDYIIKGVLDGYNPNRVEVWEIAKTNGTDEITFVKSKSNAGKDLHLRDRTQEKKTAKRASKNKLLNGIFFVLSLIPTLLALISGKIEDFVGVVPAIAILVLFAIKGGATKKAVRVICTVLIVIAIVASALLLVPHSSSAVPSALLK